MTPPHWQMTNARLRDVEGLPRVKLAGAARRKGSRHGSLASFLFFVFFCFLCLLLRFIRVVLCVSVLPAHVCMCLMPWRSEAGIRSLELELQMIVNHHVGAENQTCALCKSRQFP